MRVSARLQATAAPDAPEPMISTSTMSLRHSSRRVAPHLRALAHGIEQRPVALFDVWPLGNGGRGSRPSDRSTRSSR